VHICAGSGIVPSYSIIKHDLRVNDKLKHTLIYSNKNFEDIIFFRQLSELAKEYADRLTVIHTLTKESNDSIFGEKMLKGRVSKELIKSSITNPEIP